MMATLETTSHNYTAASRRSVLRLSERMMAGESCTLKNAANAPHPHLVTFCNRLKLLYDVNPNITIGLARTFLTVAIREGLSAREYAHLLNLPTSTMSRHLLDLGDINRKREPGLMLVEQKPNIMDRRSNVYTLTRRGARLVAALIRTDGQPGGE